jgi:8-oxo-dGTP pyrophosphatase MutT (NUDIX family)
MDPHLSGASSNNNNHDDNDNDNDSNRKTLAGDYVVQITSPNEWRIFDIGSHDAMDALFSHTPLDLPLVGLLTAIRNKDTLQIHSSTTSLIPSELVDVLARCMVQTIPNYQQYTLALLDDNPMLFTTHAALFNLPESVELVELVHPPLGSTIATVPRPLVHRHNLLHRGIGIVVSDPRTRQIYVHQRTAEKRIFPSLHDMFCGGVSTAGELPHLTAQREVAEELGLVRTGAISEAKFATTVCTAYNRCVVHVFEYDFSEELGDEIRWQPEEVAWGDFCDQDIVVQSADMSIARLLEQQKWPGKVPLDWDERTRVLSTVVHTNEPWASWDYVPDGLLVWQAWLEWRRRQTDQ